MKRLMTTAVLLLFTAAIPANAMTSVKDAKHQCRAEYKLAKKQAGALKTHQERVDAKRDAKTKYNECLQNAKKM